jgi:hypothetical protein
MALRVGETVVHLTVGVDGWAMHEPLRKGNRRSAAVLDRGQSVTTRRTCRASSIGPSESSIGTGPRPFDPLPDMLFNACLVERSWR